MSTRLLATSAATVLATALLTGSAAALDEGWCHLTPWTSDAPQTLGLYGMAVELADGEAFVYDRGLSGVHVRRLVDGVFVDTQFIQSPAGTQEDDGFGRRILRAGDELFISAMDAANELGDTGVVYGYDLVGGRWQHGRTIQAPLPILGGHFGSSIAADGDWLAIGTHEIAADDDIDARVFVFRRVVDDWQFAYFVNGLDNGIYGSELALRAREGGDLADLFVGLQGSAGPQAQQHAGAVRHFVLTGNGPFGGPTVQPDTLDAGDLYGCALAFDGEQLFVGAQNVDGFGFQDGAVFVYDVDTEAFLPTIDLVQTLTGGPEAMNAKFGDALDVDGGRLVVGARFGDDGGFDDTGRLYSYRPQFFGNGWELQDRLVPADLSVVGSLGSTVAVDGDHVLAGATASDVGDQTTAGAAYLFSLTSKDLPGGLAPVDVLATAEAYGPTDGPVFSATVLPVPGETALVGVKPVAPGTIPVVAYGLAPAEIPFHGTTLAVADAQLVILPPAAQFGQVGVGWQVPDAPGLYGFQVYLQMMLVDPDALPALSIEASNGLELTIGF